MPKLDEDKYDLGHGIFHMLDRKHNLAKVDSNDEDDIDESGSKKVRASPFTTKKHKANCPPHGELGKEKAKPNKKPNRT